MRQTDSHTYTHRERTKRGRDTHTLKTCRHMYAVTQTHIDTHVHAHIDRHARAHTHTHKHSSDVLMCQESNNNAVRQKNIFAHVDRQRAQGSLLCCVAYVL